VSEPQTDRFPEENLPGTGLFFDDKDAAAPGVDEARPEPAADSLDNAGAALAGLDAAGVEQLVSKVALRRYTKRLEEAVDARLDALDWSQVAASVENSIAGHVVDAAGINTATGEVFDGPAAEAPSEEITADEESAEEEPAEPAFRTVYDFYEGIYGPLYEHFDASPGVLASRTQSNGNVTRWCSQWWNHESVMMRMTALWQGYEGAYTEGGGAVSTWILDHADRHFDRIMDPKGPLSKCSSAHTDGMARYPTEPLPEGLNLDASTVTPEGTETKEQA